MKPEFMLYRGLVGLALGIGIALGAVGIFLIDQFTTRRRRLAVEHEVDRLATDLSELKYEIKQLQRAGGCKKSKPASRNTRSTSSEAESSDVDLLSAFDTAEDEEEFYDFSDDENEAEGSYRYDDSRLGQLLYEVDGLLRGNVEERQKAFDLLEQHYEEYSNNPELLWRFAEASHALLAALEGTITSERKKSIIQKGCEYAEKALSLDPHSYEAHKWYAINVGIRGQLSGISEKIKDGSLFKKHVEEALSIKPNDGSLHHLMGRFNFEVASLSWLERSVATTLFGGLPSASVHDALQHFLHAERLTVRPWKENRLFIARCYETLEDMQATVDWLEKAALVESTTPGDEAAERELQALLTKYASHRKNIKKNQ